MPVNYDEVLADLRQMKADAEAGIAAIERLAPRTQVAAPVPVVAPAPPVLGLAEDQGGTSVPQRVVQLLEGQPKKAFSIAEIVQEIGVEKVQTLRGALGRLVKPPAKIGKHGRGRYCALRPSHRVSSAQEDADKGPES